MIAVSTYRHAKARPTRALEVRGRRVEIASPFGTTHAYLSPTQSRPAGAGRIAGTETRRCRMIYAIGLIPILIMVLKGRAGW